MKRIVSLLIAATLGVTTPAAAEPWSEHKHKDNGPAIAAAALIGAVVGIELAQRDKRDEDRPRGRDDQPAAQAAPAISAQAALAIVARRTPGHQLNIQLFNRGGRQAWAIRWQTNDGRRIEYVVDATSGDIVSGG